MQIEPSIILISDLHLTPQSPAIFQYFDKFINSLDNISQLYILGDLFEYWLGDDTARELGYLPVENILQDLTRRGTKIYFIPGNRDFLISSDFAFRTGVSILNDASVHRLFQCSVLLLHGDSLCTDDQDHQMFRTMVNQPDWQLSFLEKPFAEREAIAQSIRFRSNIDKRYKSSEIMDANQDSIMTTFRQTETTIMIHEHTHRPGIHQWISHGKRFSRIVLGDWSTGASWIEISKSNLTLNYNQTSESLFYEDT